MRKLTLTALASMLTLVACGTPEERCLRRATPDYSVIDAEIAETEASIARGYRYDQSSRVTVGVNFCQASSNVSLCIGGDKDLPQKPIPIDVQTEKGRLASLKARRAEMIETSERAMEACRPRS